MIKLHFRISIKAHKEKVWDTMLEPETYKMWTSEFMPVSYFEGSWDRGAKIKFLIPAGDGIRPPPSRASH